MDGAPNTLLGASVAAVSKPPNAAKRSFEWAGAADTAVAAGAPQPEKTGTAAAAAGLAADALLCENHSPPNPSSAAAVVVGTCAEAMDAELTTGAPVLAQLPPNNELVGAGAGFNCVGGVATAAAALAPL
jgi:hypothetical protein